MEPDSAPVRSSEGWLAAARRRGVLRVAASYAIIAWLLIQIADTTFERLGLPDRAVTAVIIAALVGLPVALGLAWFFDLTPRGIERDSASPAATPTSMRGVRRYADIVIIGMLVIVVAVLLTRRPEVGSRAPAKGASIAVLPFNNLSGDPQQEYFSDGVARKSSGGSRWSKACALRREPLLSRSRARDSMPRPSRSDWGCVPYSREACAAQARNCACRLRSSTGKAAMCCGRRASPYDVETEASSGGVPDSESQSDEDLVYGAGVGVVLFDHLSTRLEYEIIDISDVDDASALWLTGAWRF